LEQVEKKELKCRSKAEEKQQIALMEEDEDEEEEKKKASAMELEMKKLDSLLQGKLLGGGELRDIQGKKEMKSKVELVVEVEEDEDEVRSRCKWENCGMKLEPQALLDHLITIHVKSSSPPGCRWLSCKVFGLCSSSTTWLSRHVTSHIDNKPLLCIVADCRQRFATQTSLSRHVNGHFKQPPSVPHLSGGGGQGGKKNPDTPVKKFCVRKNRRKCSSSATVPQHFGAKKDLFDIGVMAGVKDGLSRLKPREIGEEDAEEDDQWSFDRSGQSLVLHSAVRSRRLDASGNIHYLISWSPQGVLPQEWVEETNHRRQQNILISMLPAETRDAVANSIFGLRRPRRERRKVRHVPGPTPLT